MGFFDRLQAIIPKRARDVSNVAEDIAEEGLSGPVSVAAGLGLPSEETIRSGLNVVEETVEAPLVEIERAKDRAENIAATVKTVAGLLAIGATTALGGVLLRRVVS